MPYQHGWLQVLGANGAAYEIINHARTVAYLSGVVFDNGVAICDVLADGGCAAYAYGPPCGPTEAGLGHADFFADTGGGEDRMWVPEASNEFQVSTQADIRFALAGVASGGTTRYIGFHGASTSLNFSFSVHLNTSDIPVLSLSTTGTSASTATCDSALTTDDNIVLGRVTWRNSDGRVQFFRKLSVAEADIATEMANNSGWTQIGSNKTLLSGSTVFNSSAVMSVGAPGNTSSNNFVGSIYGFSVATTIDAVPGFALYPADFPSDTDATDFVSNTGHPVTVVRDGSAAQLQIVRVSDWDPLVLTTPGADSVAPWYSALYPESADAYGFWIEEWTGLDDAHIIRPVTTVGQGWGGGQLGTIRANERVMKLNVILFGKNEAAVEYLFRWLATTLSSVCSSCETDSILIRRICPTNGDLWQGVARLDDVGLVEGVKWETDPTVHSMCSVRRVSFGLTAGDPCMYVDQGDAVGPDSLANIATCLGAVNANTDRSPCRPVCNELTSSCRTVFTFSHESLGVAGPTVTLFNDNDEHSLPVRLVCYADPNEIGISPNPCGLPVLGEVYAKALPPWSTLVWDVVGRKIEYHDHTTGGYVPGWAYVNANDRPLRRFFALPCAQAHIVMEPGSLCLEAISGGWTDGSINYFDPHFPTATMSLGERLGCV